jgi:peptidoglycan DL-endopeptidase CwlO
VLAAVALGGVGEAGRQPAGAAPAETPAGKITRLRAKAARVQAAIDRMNARVESLVEDYNEVREALARTRTEQARTRRQVLDARRRLAAERAARAAAAARAGAWANTARSAGAPSGAAARAVAFARSQLGKPYVWGASGPSAYDCSGLVMAANRMAGVWLPRVSRAQWHAGPRVGLGSLAPGDLVFFAHNTGDPGSIHHVGMYVGGGAMVEAPYSGARVRVASIGRGDYIGAVRPTG